VPRRRDRARTSVRGYRRQLVRRSGLGAGWRRLPQPVRTFTPVVALLALAATYPFYLASLPGNVPIINTFPSVRSAVTILVFTTMAVGLNVVVGYCGLLDLGYVAFYAIGAYTAGWLASGQFQQVKFHFGSVGISHDARGILALRGDQPDAGEAAGIVGGELVAVALFHPVQVDPADGLTVLAGDEGDVVPPGQHVVQRFSLAQKGDDVRRGGQPRVEDVARGGLRHGQRRQRGKVAPFGRPDLMLGHSVSREGVTYAARRAPPDENGCEPRQVANLPYRPPIIVAGYFGPQAFGSGLASVAGVLLPISTS